MTATISRPQISNWETSNIPNLIGKTALITGANSGLGYYTAKALAKKNAHVVIGCRSLEKAKFMLKKKIIVAKIYFNDLSSIFFLNK